MPKLKNTAKTLAVTSNSVMNNGLACATATGYDKYKNHVRTKENLYAMSTVIPRHTYTSIRH